MNRPLLRVSAAIGVVILLAGCSTPNGLAAFQRATTTEDHLLPGIELPDKPGLEKVRLLADVDGVRYYAAQAESRALTCLVKVPNAEVGTLAAGSANSLGTGQIITISGMDGTAATLVADGFETGELEAQGWRKIHQNVLFGLR
ncbi:hypothetical protein [Arthrobacter sp. PAMC25284]|uniref:hypothetical protein n=1 Tax=Arthrobacter sp. PAMC25284 TaxID=2861279 RepID=UPI001C6392FC|nr:hypothetical protein [Arthrobacter sp. PAMC25284]QYF90414.1 hypothetical protein KY499_03610 [Arthrobacter sp. PAMC25284]